MTSLQQNGRSEQAGGAPPPAQRAENGLALLAISPVPTFLADRDGTLRFANPALSALTGRENAELVGQPLDILRSRHAEGAGWQRLTEAMPSGEAVQAELLCARKDGASLWAVVSLAPTGTAGTMLGHVVDVTRRVDTEGALALSQQREALGLLTNSVAHEFNNFLQILIGYVDGLKRRFGDRPEPFFQRAITRSTEAAERAAILTRQLLTHSRRIMPEVRPVDLNVFVAEATERLRPGLPEGITLALETTPGLVPALCNPSQVELALAHILANSCEAMDGQGTIKVATYAVAPGDGTLQRPADGAAGIAISDHGHGMSPETMSRALAPFASTRESGRGVGLAIVHGLMKRQNSVIGLESRPGEGTTVRLTFPAAPSQGTATA